MEQPLFQHVKPKKRKWVRMKKISPFPVPISSISGLPTDTAKWCYFTGFLVDNYVAIVHTGDIDFLYSMGFFGKGHLSQNQPQSVQVVHKRSSAKDLRIMSRRRYLRHVAWKTGTNEDLVDIKPSVVRQQEPLVTETFSEPSTSQEKADDHLCSETELVKSTNKTGDNSSSNVTNLVETSWEYRFSMEEEDPWANTTVQESRDFWTDSEDQDQCTSSSHNEKEAACEMSDHLSCDTVNNVNKHSTGEQLGRTESGFGGSEDIGARCLLDRVTKEDVTKCVLSVQKTSECAEDKMEGLNSLKDSESTIKSVFNTESETESKCESEDFTSSVMGNAFSDVNASCMKQNVGESSTNAGGDVPLKLADTDGEGLEISETSCLDKRCLSDHEDGDLFVVNDTDESEAESGSVRMKWEPTLKRDPYPLKEELRLSFEEAFFLSYGLGCLVLLDENKKPLDLTEMWREFCDRQPSFLSKYIAYHNFRSKGWVPKPGLKFGVDLLVYSVGPPFTHATYAVLVIEVDSASAIAEKTLSWSSLAGQHRVIKQAGKELMLCYIIKPGDLNGADLDSPRCISRFTVQEVIVRRWMSKHERDNLNFVEIP